MTDETPSPSPTTRVLQKIHRKVEVLYGTKTRNLEIKM
jgi:hypothetical protein